jgi:O-acetyl-ADP-ribose deacetylase
MEPTQKSFLDGRVRVVVGDITEQLVQAIVNAANSSLMGGGGVDGAIHGRGGPQILAECREIRRTTYPNGLPTGQAVLTTAGKLPADYVIHTVGPVYGRNRGRDAELLAACYENSLLLAREHSITSVAFPAISTGIFSYPGPEAASVASQTIGRFLNTDEGFSEIRMVFFKEIDAQTFLENQEFE